MARDLSDCHGLIVPPHRQGNGPDGDLGQDFD
jgi:hypothetical protein